jgi:PAS domain S-box-containing protein
LAATGLVAAAFLLRLPLEPLIGGSAPYAIFYLAVLTSAWFWGVTAAVFASVLSAVVAVRFIVAEPGSPIPPSLLAFALACAGMVFMARGARRIRTSEDRANSYLAAIVQSTDDAILSKNLDGIIEKCNPACERIFGYSESELVGRPVTVLIPPELQYEEPDILARLRRGERIEHFETVRVTKEGKRVDVALTISPVRDSSGRIIGVSKTVRDITEAKRAARELAAQQAWFRVTLASIGDAVIASDAEGNVIYLNPAAENLTGWKEAEANLQPLSQVFRIVNEKTREPIDDPAKLVLRSGQIVGMGNHTVLLRRDGTERPIADSAAPIQDGTGKTLGVVLVFHDVTEQRRAEAAIAEQREWFERTLESIGDAVIATDVHCNIVFMNPVAEHLTGWSLAEAQGQSCETVFRIINERSHKAVENPVKRVLAEGTIIGLANHTLLVARDGTSARSMTADHRSAIGRVASSGRCSCSATSPSGVWSSPSGTLPRRIATVCWKPSGSPAPMPRRANRVKDDFLAMVSHELRTPLNAILGWTELLLRGQKDPELLQGLDVIKRNTKIQAELISDLLDISRIVSGKLLLEVQSVDLVAVIEAAIETVQPAADAKNITIHRQLATAVGKTLGDPAACSKCSGICCRTPSSSPVAAVGSMSRCCGSTRGWKSPSRTTGWGCRRSW